MATLKERVIKVNVKIISTTSARMDLIKQHLAYNEFTKLKQPTYANNY